MRILIAPDKFKGSLAALEVAQAMAQGWCEVFPQAECRLSPIADGGEGTAELVARAFEESQRIVCEVSDALGRPVRAGYFIGKHKGMRTVAIDCSAASGFWRLTDGERDPGQSSTFGTGQLLLDAIRHGAERVIVALGGSGTNDGGCGMAAAVGYRFLDEAGEALVPVPAELPKVSRIVAPDIVFPEIIAACDVTNPLLGQNGATRVYGPQKGVRDEEVEFFEAALERLADAAKAALGVDYRNTPGAGAAGGLGFGLLTFCHARIESGFELISKLIGLEEQVQWADVVLTGEGCLDEQTTFGKGPGGVATIARRDGCVVYGVVGVSKFEGKTGAEGLFDEVVQLAAGDISEENAVEHAAELVRLRTRELARAHRARN